MPSTTTMAEAAARRTMIEDLRTGMKNLNMEFIVLEIGHPKIVRDGRTVRTVRVGDPTACVNLAVWGEAGALLEPGDILRLTRGYASTWRGALTLYSGKKGDLQKIGEFCMLFNESVNMSKPAGAGASQPETGEAASPPQPPQPPRYITYEITQNDHPAEYHGYNPSVRCGNGAEH